MMFKKIKSIFNTDTKLIIVALIALCVDIIFTILAYKTNFIAVVISIGIFILLSFFMIKLIISMQLKTIKQTFYYKDIHVVMPILFEHLNNTNDKYLYVSKKLYKVLPVINEYFYFDSTENSKHKIKILIDDTLKNLEFKTNNNYPYINNINDIYS